MTTCPLTENFGEFLPSVDGTAAVKPSRRLATHRASLARRENLLAHARLAYRDGRFAVAETLCERMLAVAPRFTPAMQLRGMVAASTGRSALALRLFREVLNIDPKSVEAWNELATQLRIAGRTAEINCG